MASQVKELIGSAVSGSRVRAHRQNPRAHAVRSAHFDRAIGVVKKHLPPIPGQAQLECVCVENIAARSQFKRLIVNALAVPNINRARRDRGITGECQY